MSTSFETFEFFEGGRTDSRAPRITVRRSGQLARSAARCHWREWPRWADRRGAPDSCWQRR